jgi:hypothetical protein
MILILENEKVIERLTKSIPLTKRFSQRSMVKDDSRDFGDMGACLDQYFGNA